MHLISEISELIPANMKLGFYYYDTKTKERMMINEHDWFPLASVTKFITSIFAWREEAYTDPEDIQRAISEHNQDSYEQLIEVISNEVLNSRLLNNNIDLKLHKNNKDKINNKGTPSSIFTILENLLNNENNQSTVIIHALKDQQDKDGFRLDQLNWHHMTGGLEGVCNDIGFIKLEDRKVILIGLLECSDPEVKWFQLEGILRDIGNLISDNLKRLT